MVLHRLIFDVDSPQAAFDALRSLDPDPDNAGLEIERHQHGSVARARLAWVKAGDPARSAGGNTLLGHIEIDGQRMTVDVNSESRAKQFQGIVSERLGPKARYRLAEIQSADKVLAQGRSSGGRSAEAPPDTPEIRALMQQVLARHYEDWLNQKIPALSNKTPLAAVRTREGREKVSALIRNIEQGGEKMSPPMDPAIIRNLRARLGLDDD